MFLWDIAKEIAKCEIHTRVYFGVLQEYTLELDCCDFKILTRNGLIENTFTSKYGKQKKKMKKKFKKNDSKRNRFYTDAGEEKDERKLIFDNNRSAEIVSRRTERTSKSASIQFAFTHNSDDF